MRAASATRLGSKEICLGGKQDGIELLPGRLQELLQQSDNLYRRIARLDDVLFGGGAPPAGGAGAVRPPERGVRE